MPCYDQLPADWVTELEKKTGAKPIIEVIYDPDGLSLPLSGKYDIVNISPIRNLRDLDIEWIGRPTVSEMKLVFNDPDDYFNPTNEDSPFHDAIGELYENHAVDATSIKIRDKEGIAFAEGEILTISDETNEEEIIVNGYTPASGSTYYHEITYSAGLTYKHAKGTRIFTRPIEKKEVLIRMRMTGCVSKVTIRRGRLLKAPECSDGTATLSIVDIKKYNLDEELIGADTDSIKKLMRIDTDGTLADSVAWNEGSGGTLDRTKVIVLDNAILGQWQIDFTSSTEFTLTKPGGTQTDGRTDFHHIFSLAGADTPIYLNSPYGCDISGDYLFVSSTTDYALTIFDISDPENIRHIGAITGAGAPNYLDKPYNIKVSGNYAYITSYEDDALTIFDISNPGSPSHIGVISGSGSPNYLQKAYAINIVEDVAYVTGLFDYSLVVIDISDPTNPILLGEIHGTLDPIFPDKLYMPYDVKVIGNYAYVTCGHSSSLEIYDISDPTNISQVGKITGAGDPNYLNSVRCLVVDGDYAYMGAPGDNSMTIVDISDPANPSFVGNITGAGDPNYLDDPIGIAKSGECVIVAGGTDNAVTAIDISDPTSPVLAGALTGAGSPNWLGYPTNLVLKGDYVFVPVGTDDAITVLRFAVSDTSAIDKESIRIPFNAWGGTPVDGDTVTFATAISWVDYNVVSILRELYEDYAEISPKLLGRSSFFGDMEIGTLYENVSAGATTIKVTVSVPSYIKTGETLTITEGVNTEDVTVATGVAVTAKYPPYIDLTISALSNSYTPDATVTWKQRAAYDADFSFDAEYHFCDIMGYKITISLDRPMAILQAIEEISKHADCITFSDNWGVEKIHTFRPHYFSSVPTVAKNTNLAVPDPIAQTKEMVNEIHVQYGYNHVESEFLYEVVFPKNDDENESYRRHGFKRSRTIKLPGVWTKSYAESIAKHKYFMWENGIKLVKFHMTLQGLVLGIGDHVTIDSLYPELSTELEIIGISGLKVLRNYDIELLAYDSKFIWNNWFLIGISGIGTGKVLW